MLTQGHGAASCDVVSTCPESWIPFDTSNNTTATAAIFTEDGWFVTGDRAFIDNDGNLSSEGREKNSSISTESSNSHMRSRRLWKMQTLQDSHHHTPHYFRTDHPTPTQKSFALSTIQILISMRSQQELTPLAALFSLSAHSHLPGQSRSYPCPEPCFTNLPWVNSRGPKLGYPSSMGPMVTMKTRKTFYSKFSKPRNANMRQLQRSMPYQQFCGMSPTCPKKSLESTTACSSSG